MSADRGNGTLYVVGTPIGNLGDLSPRARDVLCHVDIIAAEDTRRTRGLLSHIGANPKLIAYHDHNEREAAQRLVDRLLAGENLALVSDAGMPLVSDPGWSLVALAIENGIAVLSVPGPSAVMAALSVSGLTSRRFVFEGYLPRRGGERRERLSVLAQEPRTLIFFEAVHRLGDALASMAQALGAERRAALARELTKLHEATYYGTLRSLHARLGHDIPLLGEFVIVVAGAQDVPRPEALEVRRVFGLLSREVPPNRAVALTAVITGMSRNDVYELTRVPGERD
jgi:16S rRNA (cytidine1402-2'-O)-methyltransferase